MSSFRRAVSVRKNVYNKRKNKELPRKATIRKREKNFRFLQLCGGVATNFHEQSNMKRNCLEKLKLRIKSMSQSRIEMHNRILRNFECDWRNPGHCQRAKHAEIPSITTN